MEIRSREEERLKKEVEIRNQALEVLRAEYEVAKQTVKRYSWYKRLLLIRGFGLHEWSSQGLYVLTVNAQMTKP